MGSIIHEFNALGLRLCEDPLNDYSRQVRILGRR